jgi:hypothetical protein
LSRSDSPFGQESPSAPDLLVQDSVLAPSMDNRLELFVQGSPSAPSMDNRLGLFVQDSASALSTNNRFDQINSWIARSPTLNPPTDKAALESEFQQLLQQIQHQLPKMPIFEPILETDERIVQRSKKLRNWMKWDIKQQIDEEVKRLITLHNYFEFYQLYLDYKEEVSHQPEYT